MSLIPHSPLPRLPDATFAALRQLGIIQENDHLFADDDSESGDEVVGDSQSGDEVEGDSQSGDEGFEGDSQAESQDGGDGSGFSDDGDDLGSEEGAGGESDDGLSGSEMEEEYDEEVEGVEEADEDSTGSADEDLDLWSDEVNQAFWPRPIGLMPSAHLLEIYRVKLSDEERVQALRQLELFNTEHKPYIISLIGTQAWNDYSRHLGGMSEVMRAQHVLGYVQLDSHPDKQDITDSLLEAADERHSTFDALKAKSVFGLNDDRDTIDYDALGTTERNVLDEFFEGRGITDEVEKGVWLRKIIEMADEEGAASLTRLNKESYEAVEELEDFLRLKPHYRSFLADEPLPAGREVRVSGDMAERPLRGLEAVMESTRVRVAKHEGYDKEPRDVLWGGEGEINPPMDLEGMESVEVQRVDVATGNYGGRQYRIFPTDQDLPLGFFQSHSRPDPETLFTVLMPLINNQMSSVIWFSPFIKVPVLWRVTMQLEAFFGRGGMLWIHTGCEELHGGVYEQVIQLQASVQKLGGTLEITLGSNPENAGTNHAKGLVMQVARTGAIVFAGLSANLGQSGIGSDIGAHQAPRYWNVNLSNEMASFSYSLFTIIDRKKVGRAWEFLRELSETMASEWKLGRLFLPLSCMFKLRPDDTRQSGADKTSVAISHGILLARLHAKTYESQLDGHRSSAIFASLQNAIAATVDSPPDIQPRFSAYQAQLLGLSVPKPLLVKNRAGAKAAGVERAMFESLLRDNPDLSSALDNMKERQKAKTAVPRQTELRNSTRLHRQRVEAAERSILYPQKSLETPIIHVHSDPSLPHVPLNLRKSRKMVTDPYSNIPLNQLSTVALRTRVDELQDSLAAEVLIKRIGTSEWVRDKEAKAALGDDEAANTLAKNNNRHAGPRSDKSKVSVRARLKKKVGVEMLRERWERDQDPKDLAALEESNGTREYWGKQRRLAKEGNEVSIRRFEKRGASDKRFSAKREGNLTLRKRFEDTGEVDAKAKLEKSTGTPEWKAVMNLRAGAGDVEALRMLESRPGTEQWGRKLARRTAEGDPTAVVELQAQKTTRRARYQDAKRKEVPTAELRGRHKDDGDLDALALLQARTGSREWFASLRDKVKAGDMDALRRLETRVGQAEWKALWGAKADAGDTAALNKLENYRSSQTRKARRAGVASGSSTRKGQADEDVEMQDEEEEEASDEDSG